MRVKSSLINIFVGLGNQLIITVLSFISRTVFIKTLGVEYLGVNGLFTNILAMLSLAEVGIGQSIIYSLYKPVAENDYKKINVLMNLYKKAYLIIALIILLIGLSIVPFLDSIVKDSKVENIKLIYFIFLINTVAPYFYVHKNSFLNVCQKNFIVTGIYSISSVISACIRIGILYFTSNYILFLIIDCTITILNSVIVSIIANKLYPFIKNKTSDVLDKATKNTILKNIKAIVLQNIGSYLVFGTDNIIISTFVSVAAVGIYSNYSMLIEIGRTFINQVFNNIYHSVGNLVAKETSDKVYSLYKVYQLLNFWLYSIITILLAIILDPFIKLWIGPKFLMSQGVLAVLMLCFYERGMRNAITTIKTTSGIFQEDRYVPLFQALINLFFSIILVKSIGILGVFLGTLISAILGPFWTTPYLVYKKVFKKKLIKYFLNYFTYGSLGFGTYCITKMLTQFIVPKSFLDLLLVGVVCLIVPNIIYILFFHRTLEFKYLYTILENIVGRIKLKLKINKSMRNVS